MWTVQLSYPAEGLESAERRAVAESLAATECYDEDTGRLMLTFEVAAATVRQAAETALRRAAEAVAALPTGRMPTRPSQLRVLPTTEFDTETAHPSPIEQMSIAEIAELLGVSRQRVNQLIAGDDFPRPVSRIAAGPVFTAASIRAFQQRWDRRPGRRWPKPDTASPTTRRPTDTAKRETL